MEPFTCPVVRVIVAKSPDKQRPDWRTGPYYTGDYITPKALENGELAVLIPAGAVVPQAVLRRLGYYGLASAVLGEPWLAKLGDEMNRYDEAGKPPVKVLSVYTLAAVDHFANKSFKLGQCTAACFGITAQPAKESVPAPADTSYKPGVTPWAGHQLLKRMAGTPADEAEWPFAPPAGGRARLRFDRLRIDMVSNGGAMQATLSWRGRDVYNYSARWLMPGDSLCFNGIEGTVEVQLS